MSEPVLVGKIISLSLDTMTCTVNTADRDALCELPFGGEAVVVRMNDWLQNTLALSGATMRIVALEREKVDLRHEVERFTLNADDEDAIENLIHRLRRTMSDGELYGVEEQIPQMRYILREAFAPPFAEIIKLRADIQRIGHERDKMVAANVGLQERLSALEDDGK